MPDVFIAPADQAPFDVQAVILEEDTGLILSADTKIRLVQEHPVRLMTELVSFEFPAVGETVIQQGNPCFIFAVVIDLDQSPICCRDWVCAALQQSLELCSQRQMTHLALQPLGCRYGQQDPAWFFQELKRQLLSHHFSGIWLIA
ncbi:MAG: hypothetical protein OEZ23_09870 [Gammaproteobacteria bacterium]|nr:hypothetical protein [Gammaproteobacteria bacterium]